MRLRACKCSVICGAVTSSTTCYYCPFNWSSKPKWNLSYNKSQSISLDFLLWVVKYMISKTFQQDHLWSFEKEKKKEWGEKKFPFSFFNQQFFYFSSEGESWPVLRCSILVITHRNKPNKCKGMRIYLQRSKFSKKQV